jgi:hypothetical protein
MTYRHPLTSALEMDNIGHGSSGFTCGQCSSDG